MPPMVSGISDEMNSTVFHSKWPNGMPNPKQFLSICCGKYFSAFFFEIPNLVRYWAGRKVGAGDRVVYELC